MAQRVISDAEDYVPVKKYIDAIDANFDELYEAESTINEGTILYASRSRVAIADVNSGATLISGIAGKALTLVSCSALAVGGAVGAVTTVNVLGTQTSEVKLVALAQASLTQSAVLKDGGTGAAVLADGASYAPCDAGEAITVGITGSAATTATHIDFIITYTIA